MDDEQDGAMPALPGWRAHLVALEAALAAAEATAAAASAAAASSRRRAARAPRRRPRLLTTSSPVSSLAGGGGPPSRPVSPSASWSLADSSGGGSDAGASLPGSPATGLLSEERVSASAAAAAAAAAAAGVAATTLTGPVGGPGGLRSWSADVTAVEDLLAAATAEVVASRVALAEVTGALGAAGWVGGGDGGVDEAVSQRRAASPTHHPPLSALVASLLGAVAALAGRWCGRRLAGW